MKSEDIGLNKGLNADPTRPRWLAIRCRPIDYVLSRRVWIKDGRLHAEFDPFVGDASANNNVQSDSYDPLEYPDLPFIFAKLRESHDAAIARFADEWGIPYTFQAESEGIPLTEIRTEASRVWLALELIHAISDDDQERALYLTGLSCADPVEVTRKTEVTGYGFPLRPEFEPARIADMHQAGKWGRQAIRTFRYDSLTEAARTLESLLNESTTDITHSVGWDGDTNHPTIRFLAVDLVPLIYFQMAVGGTGSSPETGNRRRCNECGNLFRVGRSDQKFCPPDTRIYGKSQSGRTWSRCGDRFRARQRRRNREKVDS